MAPIRISPRWALGPLWGLRLGFVPDTVIEEGHLCKVPEPAPLIYHVLRERLTPTWREIPATIHAGGKSMSVNSCLDLVLKQIIAIKLN